jgi:hypothetical protein
VSRLRTSIANLDLAVLASIGLCTSKQEGPNLIVLKPCIFPEVELEEFNNYQR